MTDHDEMTGCGAWEAERPATLVLESPLIVYPYDPAAPSALGMQVSPAWSSHVDEMRARSHELAVRRGHIRRYS